MTKKKLSIITIFAVGLILRFYLLGEVPNGLTTDEADIGYNTYSILKTGKDVYGRNRPLFFQSFNDYKPGLLIYLQIPFVYFLGLSDFSIRVMPSILGSITPLLLYFFLKRLYPRENLLPFIAFFLTTLSPWELAVSRIDPSTLAIFLYLLFFIFFFLAINKNMKYLLLSTSVLAISFYAYYASVIYAPLICLLLFILYFNTLKKNPKVILLSAVAFIILSAPALANFLSEQGRNRVSAINIFTADVTLPASISEMNHDVENGNPFAKIFHNRRIVYANTFLDNYFDFFNLDYLFVNSARIRYFYLNYVGFFHLIELPFFLYGLTSILKRRNKNDIAILGLMIIGPVPGALVLGAAYPHRTLIFILTVQIITAIGLSTFLQSYKKRFVSKSLKLLTFTVYVMSFAFFLHQYFVHSPREFNSESNNGAWLSTEVEKAIPIVKLYQDQYDKIIFSWSVGKLAPPVYFMFYEKLDPVQFQTKAAGWTKDPPSFRQIYNQIGNIEFRAIDWEQDKDLKNTLLVGYPNEFPKYTEGIIAKTYELDGKVHFIFVDTEIIGKTY